MTVPDPYSINVAELRRIVDALLKRIEAQAGPEVIIDDEHYWDLPSPDVWDMATKPTEVDQVGSLADDLHFLRVMTDPSERRANSEPLYMLHRCSGILVRRLRSNKSLERTRDR